MGLKPIIIDLFHLFQLAFLKFIARGVMKPLKSCYFIHPSGKPRIPHLLSLPRVRGKVLQLHPWRHRSGAYSTFATLEKNL